MEKLQIHHLLKRIRVLLDENTPTSQMEKDVIKEYLRRIYEAIDQLPVKELKTKDIPPVPSRPELKEETIPKLKPETAYATFEPTKPHYQKPAPVRTDFQTPSGSTNDNSASENVIKKIEGDHTLQDLFDLGSAKELSDKISAFPVNDLHQAFSINDRLLIINELFGGDSHYFNSTIESINRSSTFEEVKSYLIRNVVHKFGWAERGRQQTVKSFLKLVRRRFQH